MSEALDALHDTASRALRHELDANLARRTAEAATAARGWAPNAEHGRLRGLVGEDPVGRPAVDLAVTIHRHLPFRETGQRVTALELREVGAPRDAPSRWVAFDAVASTLVLTDPRNPPSCDERPRANEADGVAALLMGEFGRDGFVAAGVGVRVDRAGVARLVAEGRGPDGAASERASGPLTSPAWAREVAAHAARMADGTFARPVPVPAWSPSGPPLTVDAADVRALMALAQSDPVPGLDGRGPGGLLGPGRVIPGIPRGRPWDEAELAVVAARDAALARDVPPGLAAAVAARDVELLRRAEPASGLVPLTVRRENLDGLPGPLTTLLLAEADAVRQPVWTRGPSPTLVGHFEGMLGLGHLRQGFGDRQTHRDTYLDPDAARTPSLRGLDEAGALERSRVLAAGLAESDANARAREAARAAARPARRAGRGDDAPGR